MRRSVSILAVLLAGFAFAAPARADTAIGKVARPTPVSGSDGHLLWSEYDAAARLYYLVQRFQGNIARLPVKPRSVPFDVDVGQDAGGQPVAAYSRCRREPPGRDPRTGNALTQMPQWSRGRGCDVYMLNLQTNVEIRVRGASSSHGSEFLPTVWRSRMAFARVYERRHGMAGDRTYLYFRSLTRGGTSHQIPAGNRARDRYCSGKPRRCRLLVEPGPTTLDLVSRDFVFGWDSTHGGPSSDVYREKLSTEGTQRRLVARAGSGDIQAIELLGPQIEPGGRIVWIRSMFGDSTRSDVERYNLLNGARSVGQLQPVAGQPFIDTVVAHGLDLSTSVYLASGLFPVGEPCTPQTPCLTTPGCSDVQPCELRAATSLAFAAFRER